MVGALALGLLVLGIWSAFRLPVDILPVFKAPAVQVLTYYPGMSAAAIEKTITNRMERWVGQAPGAMLVESRSVPGVSVVKVFFREDVDPNEALTLVNSLALGAMPNLPPNTLPPVALPFDATGTLPVGILAVSNPALDDARQKDFARIQLRNLLGAVPGCIAPVVVGGRDRAVMVYLDPDRMDARNLVPTDVVSALRRGNLMVSPGTAYFGNNQLLLENNAMVENVVDLNGVPIVFGGNADIYLRDVGRAEDAAAIQTSKVRIDGRPEVFVPIYRQQGASSLGVVREVRKRIPEMISRLPSGTDLRLVMDQTIAVAQSLRSLVFEGFFGAFLVSLMILLFLGDWRMTAIAVLSIPLALCGALGGLFFTGNTLNLMTLGGLALAIGPLLDDAIVELENNHRHHGMGKSRVRAALYGCAEVMLPVMVATATTIIVLLPLGFIPGIGGFLFRPLAWAVAFAMLTSFLLSRTFVPVMCAYFLPEDQAREGRGVFFKPVERLRDSYGRLLEGCLAQRGWLLAGVGAVFLITVPAAMKLGLEFFPKVDGGQITMRVRAPSNLRLQATEARVKEVEAFVRATLPSSDVEMIVSEIGLNPDWSSAYTTNAGQQDAVIRVQLSARRSLGAPEAAARLRGAFEKNPDFNDLRADFETGGMVSTALNLGATSPVNIQIEGGETSVLLSYARQVRNAVAKIPGAVDVRILQRNDAPYLVLEVDRMKAARLGLSAQDVITQVVVALNSSVSVDRNFWVDARSGNQYFVGVQFPEDAGRTLEDVLAMRVSTVSGGGMAPPLTLGSLVSTRRKNGEVEIHHSNLQRTVNVLANTEGRDLGAVSRDIERAVDALAPPAGLRVAITGEFGKMNEAFRNLGLGILFSALLVYLLQVVLFRSWLGPAVIMASVPLGFVGVVWILFATGTTLNVQSLLGATFLIGIAVNNGVLLVDGANRLRGSGTSAVEAMCQAARRRFKPILMTFLATFLAMLPMAIGFGRGGEAAIPLARAIVGGLTVSTLLTLFLIPALYCIIVRRPPGASSRVDRELENPSL
jgi:multidrug efflux pump subunit AcrB